MTKRVINTGLLMRPIAHFSHAVRVGALVHVGATAGTDASRRLAGQSAGLVDIAAQTRQMFSNLDTVLGLLGARLEHVVRVKTYITDLRDLPIYREIYAAHFGAVRPSHSVVGSWGFPLPQAAIETEIVALIDIGASRPEPRGLPPAAAGEAQGGVRAGPWHYGTALPVEDHGRVVRGGIAPQADAVLTRLKAMLAAADLGPGDVVNLHVTLADPRDLSSFEAAYRKIFRAPYPSRTIVVAPLPSPDMRVQIEAVAMEGGGQPVTGPWTNPALDSASPAMLAGECLFVSGQQGLGFDGHPAEGGYAQTLAAWDRVRVLLDAVGMTREDILRTNNVLTDWRLYGGFNRGYGMNVTAPYPPRATVLGALTHPAACVQIEAIAHRHGREATVVDVNDGSRDEEGDRRQSTELRR